jgi:hypothetical protein
MAVAGVAAGVANIVRERELDFDFELSLLCKRKRVTVLGIL